MIEKQASWIDKVNQISLYHKERLRLDNKWTIKQTAKELNWSTGRISEYLQLADWLKTHNKQLERYKSIEDALSWVRNKKKELKLL